MCIPFPKPHSAPLSIEFKVQVASNFWMCASMHCCLSCADLRIKSCSESLKKKIKKSIYWKKIKNSNKKSTLPQRTVSKMISPQMEWKRRTRILVEWGAQQREVGQGSKLEERWRYERSKPWRRKEKKGKEIGKHRHPAVPQWIKF